MAVTLDLSMVLIGLGLFSLVLYVTPAPIRLTRMTMMVGAGVGATVLIFYKALWCLADADSPGMRWTRLRLLNFDGRPPTRGERVLRLLAGCLSVLSAGLGLLWALVDEETLSWHDHISKTFPTPNRHW